jgi:hypothetical protein
MKMTSYLVVVRDDQVKPRMTIKTPVIAKQPENALEATLRRFGPVIFPQGLQSVSQAEIYRLNNKGRREDLVLQVTKGKYYRR